MDNKFHTNLIVSSSPHIVTESDTTRLMGSVLLALAPAWIASIYIFGLRALLLSVVCVAASVLFEYLFNAIVHKKQTVGDLSAALTGLLIAFNVPASFPFWQAIIGLPVLAGYHRMPLRHRSSQGTLRRNRKELLEPCYHSTYIPVHLVLGQHVNMATDETRRKHRRGHRTYTSRSLCRGKH